MRVARAECHSFIRGLWQATSDKTWVSLPHAIRQADDKVEQLRRAYSHGFSIPRTFCGNDPNQIRAFCDELGGIDHTIYKPFNSIMFSSGNKMEVVYTVQLGRESYEKLGDVRYCPGIFQERIDKLCDIRVTVIGREVFAAAIDSQSHGDTEIDWRAYSWMGGNFPPHQATELPAELSARCVKLVESYGLRFGAIDFVLTPEGDYMFLELNPNGQWAWVELATGQSMAEALVGALAA